MIKDFKVTGTSVDHNTYLVSDYPLKIDKWWFILMHPKACW